MPGYTIRGGLLVLALLAGGAHPSLAQRIAPSTATRTVYLDREGVVRWRDDRKEVALFGANYVLPSASDYRAAGYVGADRKGMIDEDMGHFARMGWDGLRLTFWGDWESADSAGNLLDNDHLDLLDLLVARARERGIYMLLSPIQLYNANWPDALDDTTSPGFGRRYSRERMGTDPDAIKAQVNYLRQILTHVNRYTGVALKDEPAVLFIELVNEPVHHPEDLAGSVRYIDTLIDAVRATGCRKLVFYNVSQDFRIGPAIRRSRAQGVTFGWYPSGLNSGYELPGNFLRAVDAFPDMARPELAGLPRIVYEFDTPDLRTGTLYPAMARTFRAVGAQFAAMFAYDMLRTASRNLGWQTHYLSLVYTPRKAMSAIIAAEAMHRLPRMRSYGSYPRNTRFGDFRVSYPDDLGELVARDAFLHAGTTTSRPPAPDSLTRVAGYGSSPIVTYEGEGVYFLDRVRRGVWRLEVYPDAVPIRDPFEPPQAVKVVTRVVHRVWPMRISLPELGGSFTVQGVSGAETPVRASDGRFLVRPGVYVLGADGPVDRKTLPDRLGRLAFAEHHAPDPETLPPTVVAELPPAYVAGNELEIRARIIDSTPPDSAILYVRPVGGASYRGFTMRSAGGYGYTATIPSGALQEGPHEMVVTVHRAGSALSFPGMTTGRPTDWNYSGETGWPVDVVSDRTPLRLFDPASDATRLAFTRIGDAGRRGLFRLSLSEATGRAVFHLALPVDSSGWSPADYTASLVVAERVRARGATAAAFTTLRLRARSLGPGQLLHVTLVEADGTSWSKAVRLDDTWNDHVVRLTDLALGKGRKLPQGFPGEWNYWIDPADGRGGKGDRPQVVEVERLQLSVQPESGVSARPDGYGVEIESVTLDAAGTGGVR